MQEMWVPSLGQEDPIEKGMATHSGILSWRIPGTGEPGGLPSMGSHSRTQLKRRSSSSSSSRYPASWASQMAQQVKNPPDMQGTQEMWVPSLGQEDLLEEGMAIYSNILA